MIFLRHVCRGETLIFPSLPFFPIDEYQREPRKDLLKLIYSLIFSYNVFSHILSKKKVNSCFSVSTARLLGDMYTKTNTEYTHTHTVITGLLQSTGCCVTSAPPHNKENGRVAPDKRRRSRDGGGDNRKDRIGSLETQP